MERRHQRCTNLGALVSTGASHNNSTLVSDNPNDSESINES
jgi:hypothetical protein